MRRPPCAASEWASLWQSPQEGQRWGTKVSQSHLCHVLKASRSLKLRGPGCLPVAIFCLPPYMSPCDLPPRFLLRPLLRPSLKFLHTRGHQHLLSPAHPFALLCQECWQKGQQWEPLPHPCPAITASCICVYLCWAS